MIRTADFIVIGSGAVGNSAAYYLTKKGYSVIVLEKYGVGHGGSSRNGGGVRQSGRSRTELPLAMYGARHIWPGLSEELGVNVEYHKDGNLRLGKTEAHRKILENIVRYSTELGLEIKLISGDEVRQICPQISEEVTCASWCPTDGHANPMMTTLAFYRRARELGAVYITGENVTGIGTVKGRARRVYTDANVYEAGGIVLAAGYESRQIMRTVGLDVPMQKWINEAIVTEMQPKMFPQMLGTAATNFYGHQTEHGSFVFGGNAGYDGYMGQHDKDRPQNSPFHAGYVCRGVIGYIPVLKEAKIVRTWAGWCDMTPDEAPVLSNVEEVPGLTIGCGLSGHGFGLSPAAGMLLSQLATEETETIVDPRVFRYDRFLPRG